MSIISSDKPKWGNVKRAIKKAVQANLMQNINYVPNEIHFWNGVYVRLTQSHQIYYAKLFGQMKAERQRVYMELSQQGEQ